MAGLSANPDNLFDFCFCCCLLELQVFTLTRAPPAGKITQRKAEKGPTSRSILRAATELSSLKSIREDASVLRKLPSAKGKYTQRCTALCWCVLRTVDSWREQTFDVTLEELGQDAIGSQLVKHAAEELFGYPCNIPWDQHTAIKRMTVLDKRSHSTSVY